MNKLFYVLIAGAIACLAMMASSPETKAQADPPQPDPAPAVPADPCAPAPLPKPEAKSEQLSGQTASTEKVDVTDQGSKPHAESHEPH